MVMAKAGFTGNCLLIHSTLPPAFGTNMILGMRTVLSDPATLQRRTLLSRFLWYTSFVPLHSPCLGLRFRINIRGIPDFNSKEWGGNPLGVKEFRNSVVYRNSSSVFVTWSALRSTSDDPGSFELSISFNIWTSLFVGAKIARPSIQRGSVSRFYQHTVPQNGVTLKIY